METVSHAQLLMWTVTFFFGGMGVYAVVFWFIVNGLKKSVVLLRGEVKGFELNRLKAVEGFDNKFQELYGKKVDVVVYAKNHEAMETIFKTLQTVDRCDIIRHGCGDHILNRLNDMQAMINRVLDNQNEFGNLKETLKMVAERQVQVIDRLDRHINGK